MNSTSQKSFSALSMLLPRFLTLMALGLSISIFSTTESASAASIYWNGTGTDWGSVSSWSLDPNLPTPNPAAVPGATDLALFSINSSNITSVPQVVNLNAARSALGLSFQSANVATTALRGGNANQTLTLGTSGITVNSGAGAVTIGSSTAGQNVSLLLSASQGFVSNSVNPLTIVNGVTLSVAGAQTLTLNGTSVANNTLSGIIGNGSGTLSILKTGAGTWTLSGANTFTGGVTLSAGTLNINNASALGAVAGKFTVNGGTIDNTSGLSITTLAYPVEIGGNFNFLGGRGTTHDLNFGTGAVNLGVTAGARTITVTQGTLAFGGVISNGTGGTPGTALVKAGGGALSLAGNNTFTGGVTLNAGTLNINNAGALGTVAGTFLINGGLLDNTTGTAITNANNNPVTINGDFSFNGGAGTTHDLNLGTGATNLGTAAGTSRTINTDGGTLTLGGAIANGTTASSLIKTGPGTLVLGGANGFSGSTTVSGGILRLNNAVNGAAKLSDTSALILNGGTLDLSGGSGTETVGSTTLGASTTSSVSRSSGTSVLAMGNITAQAGAFVKFGADSIATTTSPNTNGILGGWATVGGANWAFADGSAGNAIKGLLSYTSVNRLGGTIITGATTNVKIVESGSTGNIALSGGALTEINSLNMGAAGGTAIIDPASNGDVFRIGSDTGGGILLPATSGALMIGTASGDGLLTTGGTANATPVTLYFDNEHATNLLTVNSVIANNGTDVVSVAKTGTGVLVFSGTNTYTGATYVSQGVLRAGGAAGGQAFGSLSAVTLASTPSTVLDLSGTSQTVGSLAGGGGTGGNVLLGAGTLTTGGDNSSTSFAGVITGTGGVTKTGAGTWTLSGGNSYTGATMVNGGILDLAAASNVQVLSDLTAVVLANTPGASLNLNSRSETIGSLAGGGSSGGNVSLGAGALTTGRDGTSTSFGGVISGTGGSLVTKVGAGVMTLTGQNTFSNLSVDGGAVTLNNALGNALSNTAAVRLTRAGAALNLATSETIGSINAASDTFINLTGGTLTVTDPSSVNFNGTISANSNLVTAIGSTAGLTPGMYVAGVGIPAGAQIASIVNGTSLLMTVNATFGGTTSIIYNSNYSVTPTVATTTSASRLLTVSSTTGLSEGMFVNGTGITAGTRVAQILSGTTLLIDQGASSTGTNPITFIGSDQINGNLTGSSGFTKTGTGELRVTGSFTQSGTFTVNDGPTSSITTIPESSLLIGTTLKPGNVLSDTATLTLGTPAGARSVDFFQNDTNLAGFERVGALSGGNSNTTINLLNRSSVTVLATGGNNSSTTWNGIIAGDNGGAWVIKEGTGKMTVTNLQTNDGVWLVDGGILAAGVANAFDDASILYATNKTGAGLEMNFSDTVSGLFGGGKGSIRNFGLNGAPVGFLNGNYINGTGGGIALNATLAVNNDTAANIFIYGGVLSGAGGLSKSNRSTLELRGANTYTGATTISSAPADGTVSVLRLGVYGGASGLGAPTVGGQGSLSASTSVSMSSAAAGTVGNATRDSLFDLNGAAQTLNTLTATGAGTSQVALGGGSLTITTNTGSSGSFNGVISGLGDVNVTKTGGLRWDLTGTNTFNGTLNVTGAGTTVRLNNVLGDTLADNTAINVGSGATVVINQGDAIGSISGAGTIDIDPFNNNALLQLTAARSGAISATPFSGNLTNINAGGTSGAFQISGGGLRMSGNNTDFAGTFVVGGTTNVPGKASLILDYSGGATDILPDGLSATDGVFFGGATIYLKGNSTADSTIKTTLNPGASSIYAFPSDTSRIGLGDLVPTVGGTLHVGGAVAATSVVNVNSIIGGYATFGTAGQTAHQATTWAVSNGVGSAITGLAAYTNSAAGTQFGAAVNYNVTQADAESGTVNTIRFNTNSALTLTLNAGASILNSGGILVTASTGTNTSTIGGAGTLTASATAGQVYVHQYSPSGNFLINVPINDNGTAIGLTKAGQGTLILGSNNNFSGQITIGAGRVVVGNGGAAGTLGTGLLNIINNGVLSVNRSTSFEIANAIDGTGWIRQEGAGTFRLSATNSTYSGRISVAAGRTMEVTSSTLNSTTGVQSGGFGTTEGFTSVEAGGSLVLGDGAVSFLDLAEMIVLKGATLRDNTVAGAAVQSRGDMILLGQTNTITSTAATDEFRIAGDIFGAADVSASAGKQLTDVVIGGSGTVIFESARNSYLGTTTINAGAGLQLGGTNLVVSTLVTTGGSIGRGNIVDNGTLTLNMNDAHFVLGNTITGTGGIVMNRNAVYLAGANTNSGTTLVTPRPGENVNADLRVGIDTFNSSLGSGAITLTGGTFNGGNGDALLRYHVNNDYTMANSINLNPSFDSQTTPDPKNVSLIRYGLGSMTLTGTVTVGDTSGGPGTQRAIIQSDGGGRLNFNATLVADSTKLLNFTNNGIIVFGGTASNTYNGILAGNNVWVFKNTGTTTLTGVNTFNTGNTYIDKGTVVMSNAAGTTIQDDNDTHVLQGATLRSTVSETIGQLYMQRGSTLNITTGNTLTVDDGGAQLIAGAVTGGGNLTLALGNYMAMHGTNTLTGNVLLNNGTIQTRSLVNALGTAAAVTLGSGTNAGALEYIGAGETFAKNITLSSTGSNRITANGSGALVLSGGITTTSNSTLQLTGQTGGYFNPITNKVTGAITEGASTLSLAMPATANDDRFGVTGRWALTNKTNDFSGSITVNVGMLEIGGVLNDGGAGLGGLGNGTGTTSSMGDLTATRTINLGTNNFDGRRYDASGGGDQIGAVGTGTPTSTVTPTGSVGTIIFNDPNAGTATLGSNITFTQSWSSATNPGAGQIINDGAKVIIIDGNLTSGASGNRNWVLDGTNTGDNTINGVISNGTGNVVSILKEGAGTWVLNNVANTFTGGVSVTNGVLKISGGGVINDGAAVAVTGAGADGIFSGTARFQVAGSETIGTLTGNINTSVQIDAGQTLTIAGGSSTFNGIISGAGSLTRTVAGTAAGTLTTSDKNTYTGVTTIGSVGTSTVSAGITVYQLANGGSSSGLGASSNAATNLVFVSNTAANQGGILTWNGFASQGTDRLFTMGLGTAAATINAAGAVIGTTAPAVTFSNTGAIVMSGSGTRTLTLGGATIADNVFRPQITDGGGATSLIKAGNGLWVLNPDVAGNGFTGGTTITGGTLAIQSGNALGSGTVTISGAAGVGLDLRNGLNLANAITNSTADGGVRASSGANMLTGTVTATAQMRVAVDAGASVELNNATSALTGAGTVIKFGDGNLIYSGTNNATGATQVRGGALVLDYSNLNTTKLADGASLTLGGAGGLTTAGVDDNVAGLTSIIGTTGGTIQLKGGSHTEAVSATTLSQGASAVTQVSGSSVLRMNVITRNAGATINFSGPGIAQTDTNNVNGILGVGYATINKTDWATSVTSGAADTLITTYSAYTTDVYGAANNVNVTSFAGVGTAANTLRFNTAAGGTLNLGGGTLSMTGGGLLVTPNVTSGPVVITNGTIRNAATTAGLEALVIHENSSQPLQIDAVIQNNTNPQALTKSGTGTVYLNALNTQTGALNLNEGVLQVGGTAASPNVATNAALGGTNVAINMSGGSTLRFLSSNPTAQDLSTVQGGGTIILAAGNTMPVLMDTDNSNFFGDIEVRGGAIQIASANALGSNRGITSIFSGGSLQFTATMSTPEYIYMNDGAALTTVASVTGTLSGPQFLQNTTSAGATYDLPAPVATGTVGLNITGVVSGSNGFTKTGNGILQISANNFTDVIDGFTAANKTPSLSGQIKVNQGLLYVGNARALSATGLGNETVVASGATVDLRGVALNYGDDSDPSREIFKISGSGVNGTGALRNTTGTGQFSGLVLDANSTVSGGGFLNGSRLDLSTYDTNVNNGSTLGGNFTRNQPTIAGNSKDLIVLGSSTGGNLVMHEPSFTSALNSLTVKEGILRIEQDVPPNSAWTGISAASITNGITVAYGGASLADQANSSLGMGPNVGARLNLYRNSDIHHTVNITMDGVTAAANGGANYIDLGTDTIVAPRTYLDGTINLSGTADRNIFQTEAGPSISVVEQGNLTTGLRSKLIVGGQIVGTGGFTKTGFSELRLTNDNTFTGALNVLRFGFTSAPWQSNTVQINGVDYQTFGDAEGWGEWGLTLSGANGRVSGTSTINLQRRGMITLDNTTRLDASSGGVTGGNNNDRINNSATFNLSNGWLRINGGTTANTEALATTGGAKMNIQTGTTILDLYPKDGANVNMTLTIGEIARSAGGVLRIQDLDATSTFSTASPAGADSVRVQLTSIGTLAQVGGGGAAGSTTRNVVVGVLGGIVPVGLDVDLRSLGFANASITDLYNQQRNLQFLAGSHFMTYDGGFLRPLDDSEYFTPSDGVLTSSNGTNQNVAINDAATIVSGNTSINSLRFGPVSDNNGSGGTFQTGSSLTSLTDHHAVNLYVDGTLSITSGMLSSAYFTIGNSSSLSTVIIGGNLDFGTREAIINNQNGMYRLTDGTIATGNLEIRSNILGSGGLTKTGLAQVVLDGQNAYTGLTSISDGTLFIRNGRTGLGAGGAGNGVYISGNGNLNSGNGIQIGTAAAREDIFVGALNGDQQIMRVDNDLTNWFSNVTIDNVDAAGLILGTPRIRTDGAATSIINGNIFGGDTPVSNDVLQLDPRRVSFNSAGSNVFIIRGQIGDKNDGAGNAIPISNPISTLPTLAGTRTNENEVLRVDLGGASLETNYLMERQYNAAGRLTLESGNLFINYDPAGVSNDGTGFWTTAAIGKIPNADSTTTSFAVNGGSVFGGFQLGTTTGTGVNNGNTGLFLTRANQVFNMASWSTVGSGAKYIGGTNESGTVTFGNGTGSLTLSGAASQLYAASGGTVVFNQRMTGNVSGFGFVKIGRGTVELQNTSLNTASDANFELAGGTLILNHNGQNVARVGNSNAAFSGGTLRVQANTTAATTASLATSNIAGSVVAFRSGGSEIIAEARSGQSMTLNIGNANANNSAANLTRVAGATANFVEWSNGSGTPTITMDYNATALASQAKNAVIPWATFGTAPRTATDFAMVDGTASNRVKGFVRSAAEEQNDVTLWSTIGTNPNVSENGSSGFRGTMVTESVNSLHFDAPADSRIDISGTLTIFSGSMMVSSAVGSANKSITGGNITAGAGAGGELIIHQYSAGNLLLDSDISGPNALTVTGPGTTNPSEFNTTGVVTLVGANTYTGKTVVNGAVLSIATETSLGIVPAANVQDQVTLNGGTLRFTGSNESLSQNRGITIGSNGGVMEITNPDGNLFIQTGIASAGTYRGDLIKTGPGSLSLEGDAGNQNSFNGLIDVREGTLRIAGEDAALTNATTVKTILGSTQSWADGTVFRNGSNFVIQMGHGSENTANTVEWLVDEFFTFEGNNRVTVGSTGLQYLRLTDLTLQSSNKTVNLNGPIQINGAVTIDTVGGQILRLNNGSGYLTGSGDIIKEGTGRVEFRANTPDWTGNLIINQGDVYALNQADVIGTGYLTGKSITLGSTEQQGNARFLLQNPDTVQNWAVEIGHDINVTYNPAQNKTLAVETAGNGNKISFNGNITLNDNLQIYMNDGAEVGGSQNYVNFNGAFRDGAVTSGNLTIFGDDAGGANDNTSGRTVNYAVLNGNNSLWTGDVTISGHTTYDQDQTTVVRFGNNQALTAANEVTMNYNSMIQTGGFSVTIGGLKTLGGNGPFYGSSNTMYASTNGSTEIIENAALTPGTLTINQTTPVNSEVSWDAKFRDGTLNSVFFAPGTNTNQASAALNLVKSGVGWATLTLDNDYTGTTTVAAGVLQVGRGSTGDTGAPTAAGLVVNSGATLAGTGIVQGTAVVQSGAVVKPGDVAGAAMGTLTFAGNTTLSSGSTTTMQVQRATYNNTGYVGYTAGANYTAWLNGITSDTYSPTLSDPVLETQHDAVSILGALTWAAGTKITLTNNGYNPAAGDIFDLFDWFSVTGTINVGSALRTGTEAGTDLDLFELGGDFRWDTSLFNSQGILVVTLPGIVPEPGRLMLLLVGLGGAMLRRRRARR